MNFLLELKNTIFHFWFVKVILGAVALCWLSLAVQKIILKLRAPSRRDSEASSNEEQDLDDVV